MKKFKTLLVMAALVLTLGVCVTACGNDNGKEDRKSVV